MSSKIIGIAGGSGSGKTTLCRQLAASLGDRCTVISSDDYYRSNDHLTPHERAKLNFDHPDSIDLALLSEHLRLLRQSKSVPVPKYCFETHTRLSAHRIVESRPVVLVEGVLIFAHQDLRASMDLRIFVDASNTLRYERRLARDTEERGRTHESVAEQWSKTVAPMYEQFVAPTRPSAHLIVNAHEPNQAALTTLLHGIEHT